MGTSPFGASAHTVTGVYFVADTVSLLFGDDEVVIYPLVPPFLTELARVLDPPEWALIQLAAARPRQWVVPEGI